MLSRLLALGNRLPVPVRRALKRVPRIDRLRARLAGKPRPEGPPPGELRAVVYPPTWARWDVMRQRPQYLLEAFAAAGHKVYFVDPREAAPRSAGEVAIVPDLGHVPGRGVILYVHFAPARTMFGGFEDPVVVYDILDDLTIYEPNEIGMPPERTVAAHHPEVVQSAAIVAVSSPVLRERHVAERADLILVENGVDPGRFATPAPRPGDLPARDPQRPIVGYHGAIAPWVDFDLLAGTAALLPDWTFVLVGPVEAGSEAGAARLERLPNVSLLGPRSSDDMPAYVQAFDIGTVWFRVDDLTTAVSPLKLFEYLAAGKPVVATPLPACVAAETVRTAATAEEFAAALVAARDDAGRSDFVAAAQRVAAAASWDARLEPVLTALDRAGLRRVPP